MDRLAPLDNGETGAAWCAGDKGSLINGEDTFVEENCVGIHVEGRGGKVTRFAERIQGPSHRFLRPEGAAGSLSLR